MPTAGPTVVLADDEPDVLASLRDLFVSSGNFDVAAAVATGDELLAAVARHHPDLVVTDLQMPAGELHLVRQLGSLSPRPLVIALSASVGASLARKLRDAGADLVLRKGIDAPVVAAEQLWASRQG